MIQPPGEPREQHLGDVRPQKFELGTQNFIKDEMTRRVDILGRNFFLKRKNVKN